MKRNERNSAYLIFTSTALSGISIWALKRWGSTPGPFGPVQHPLLDELHLLHNIFNLLFLGMFGWLAAIHIRIKLRTSNERKFSGIALIILFSLIPLSGQTLLYIPSKEVLGYVRQIHLILGLVGMILFYFHSRDKKALSY